MPRALIVEDDPALRLLSRVNLELDGFDVVEAATVAEAEAAVAAAVPDVVLLDVHLGIEQTDSLFDRLRVERIPVAAVTGTAEIGEVRDRADATLAKPYNPEDLVAIAKRLARVPE
jgi:DNA-binding response OmpR family regulator